MKLNLNLHGPQGSLTVEADNIEAIARVYVTLHALSAQGAMPVFGVAYAEQIAPGCTSTDFPQPFHDAGPVGDVTDAQRNTIAQAAADIRETRKPGKSKKARAQAEVETPPSPTTPVEPQPEPETESAAAPLDRGAATEALTKLLREKGDDAVRRVLVQFGVTRFGLFVAEDYAAFVAAVEAEGAA